METCKLCRLWYSETEECRLFPQYVRREANDWCGQFQAAELSQELLATDLLMMNLTPRTRAICRNLNIDNVDDLLLLGRSAIAPKGVLDKQAIRELKAALKRLGVEW